MECRNPDIGADRECYIFLSDRGDRGPQGSAFFVLIFVLIFVFWGLGAKNETRIKTKIKTRRVAEIGVRWQKCRINFRTLMAVNRPENAF